MPVEYFVRFQGKCYDVGTRFKFRTGSAAWASILEGTIESISHNIVFIRLTDGGSYQLSKIWGLENTIVEIIEPIYYEEPAVEYKRGIRGGVCPPEDEIFIGWVWYIVIMAVAFIFKILL